MPLWAIVNIKMIKKKPCHLIPYILQIFFKIQVQYQDNSTNDTCMDSLNPLAS